MSYPHRLAIIHLALALTVGAGGPAPAQVPATTPPPQTDVLPELTGSLLERQDLRHVVELQTRRDTSAIVDLLGHADRDVRARAALALGSVRAPGSVAAVARLLSDEDAHVRAFAAFALGQSENVTATAPLLDALHSEKDPRALTQIIHGLGRVGDRPALAALARADLAPVLEAERALAVARLGTRDVHDPAALHLLVERLRSEDPRVRRNAAYYFGRITDTAPWQDYVGAVAQASVSLDVDDEAQLFLVTALGRLGQVEHEDAIVRLLRGSADWRVRVNAARALAGGWRTDGATMALLDRLGDESPHVAIAAAGALPAGHLTGAQLDLLERRMASHPAEWHVWTGYLPALVAAGHLNPVLAVLDGNLSVPARAAALRAFGTADDAATLRLLVDASAHPEPRVAAAAVDVLRERWRREADARRAELYFETFTTALRRGEGAVVFTAAPALSDSLFLAMGAGEVLRQVYGELDPARNVGPMEAIIRAHSIARDSAALDFMVDTAVMGRHPVLRRAATDALTARFGEGYQFTSIGGQPPTFPRMDWDQLRRLGASPRLVLETERGTIVLELDTEWAPATVQAITGFAREGRYDGVEFHRVVPNFVIQGGDFDPGDGFGGPDFLLPSELTPLPYQTGTLGMASSGPDTEGSQFFVTHSMHPHLEGRYTVFGRVLSGGRVVDQIQVGDRVVSARVEPSR